jgi:hypothetical protein
MGQNDPPIISTLRLIHLGTKSTAPYDHSIFDITAMTLALILVVQVY